MLYCCDTSLFTVKFSESLSSVIIYWYYSCQDDTWSQ